MKRSFLIVVAAVAVLALALIGSRVNAASTSKTTTAPGEGRMHYQRQTSTNFKQVAEKDGHTGVTIHYNVYGNRGVNKHNAVPYVQP